MQSCGKYHMENVQGIATVNHQAITIQHSLNKKEEEVKLYTSYLGEVTATCTYLMEKTIYWTVLKR